MQTADLIPIIAEVAEHLAFLLPLGTCEPPPPEARTVSVRIPFATAAGGGGDVPHHGALHLALTLGAAQAAARGMLGLMDDQPPSAEDLQDSAGELANVLLGNLLPRHYGEEVEFHLGQPESEPAWDPAAPWTALDLGDGVLAVALIETPVGATR